MQNKLQEYKIAHVGFVVKDLEAAKKRLEDLYEVTQWQMVEWKPQKVVYKGEVSTDTYVRIAISYPAEGTRIEILEPKTKGFHMDILQKGTQTINHICHVVDHFDETVEAYIKAGCRLVMETEYTDTIRGFRRCHYLYDDVLNTYFEIAEIPYFVNEKGEKV